MRFAVSASSLLTSALGLIATISMALAGWGLSMAHSLSVEMARQSEEIKQLQQDNDDVESLKSTARKHWKLLGWSRDQINNLKVKNGEPITGWPDVD